MYIMQRERSCGAAEYKHILLRQLRKPLIAFECVLHANCLSVNVNTPICLSYTLMC